jgi:hypothetical protein
MNIERRGPAKLADVKIAIAQMERQYRVQAESLLAMSDPTELVPEDEIARLQFLIEQRDALLRERSSWTPNYSLATEQGTMLPEVDREAVECGVAA